MSSKFTANIWTSLSTQTLTELIALLPDIIKSYPESDAPVLLYEFLASNMPKFEDQLSEPCSTSPGNQAFLSESTGNAMKRQLRPRTNIDISTEPAAQITLGSSSKSSKSFKIKRQPLSRRNIGAKSKRCCRDGMRVELFEGPPRKRANIDYGDNKETEQEDENEDEEDEEGKDEEREQDEERKGDLTNKEVAWQTDGSPPPPDTDMLTRIAELANLWSSDKLKHIQNLLAVIQEQKCAIVNPTSANDLTLQKLIRKCQTNGENGQYLSFISMIDNIRLAFHLAFFKNSPKASFRQLEKDMGLSRGNTVYSATYSSIRDGRAVYSSNQNNSRYGIYLLQDSPFPEMQAQSQLRFTIFTGGLDCCSKDLVLNFSDISGCDELLSTLPFNTYTLPERDINIWSPLLSPNTVSHKYLSFIDQPAVEMADRQLVEIKSPLCMSAFLPSPVNKENRSLWTSQERQKAMKATKVTDLRDIQPKINELFDGSIRKDGQYLHISHGAVENQDVKFVDKDGKFLGLWISQTSPIINDRLQQLQDYLHVEMPSQMIPIDSSLNPGGTFTTMHFGYFTRYGEQGTGAPIGIHPDLLHKTGRSRVNHMQRIPYASSTIHANQEQYSILAEIIQDICRLIAQAIEKYLPDVYSRLNFVCSLLPMGENPVTAPFTGLVLNIQCTTTGHLDAEDDLEWMEKSYDYYF
ncbi:hypothetical protein BDR07DRAFT_1380057 [Suillus spraguei]|nr:hypothetical protein BDR07DRAFT_1380057 [Suillus spraguei]